MQFRIDPPDNALHDTLLGHLDALPAGRMSALALQLGLVQQSLQPVVHKPLIAIFAGDHGAIAAGASSLPQRQTWGAVERLLGGHSVLNAACRDMALALTVVDAGVSHDFTHRPGLAHAKIEHGTANYALEPAMWRSQLERALEYGRGLAHQHAAQDGNVLGLSSIGVGAEASAALLAHCMHGIELDVLAAAAPDRQDDALQRRRALLARSLARRGRIDDPFEALREFGGFETAMLVGAMLGAAEKHLIVIIDGLVTTSAFAVAQRIAPAAAQYCIHATRAEHEGHALLQSALGAQPLLDPDLTPGDGMGLALSIPLLRAAAACLHSRAGIASAGQGSGRG